jgi:hypothetical protein
VKGRYGWGLLLLVVVSWDVAAAFTNGETLTWTFRRAVSQTGWRWPVLLLIVLLVVHLFLPEHLAEKYPVHQIRTPPDRRPPTSSQPTEPQPR